MAQWSARFGHGRGWPSIHMARALRQLRRLPRTANLRAAGALGGAACAGSFVAAAAVGASPPAPDKGQAGSGKSWRDFGHPGRRVTDALLLLNAACYCLQLVTQGALTLWGAKENSLIAAGQWWRLLTPIFLHSGLIHLAVNCHALHTLGPLAETVSGKARFVAVYLLSGVAGTLASYLFTPAPSLGASSAVFGVGAALGLYYHRHRHLYGSFSEQMLSSLGWTVALNAAYSLLNKRIDNWGHLGGMLGGAVLSYLLGPRLMPVGPDGLLQDQPPVGLMAFDGFMRKVPAAVGSSSGAGSSSSSAASSSISSSTAGSSSSAGAPGGSSAAPSLPSRPQRALTAKEQHWLEWRAQQEKLLARRQAEGEA